MALMRVILSYCVSSSPSSMQSIRSGDLVPTIRAARISSITYPPPRLLALAREMRN